MSLLPSRLKQLRLEKALRQSDIAKALEVSTRTYQSYELGDREPSTDRLIQLADFFDVTTDYLLGRE